MDKPTTEPGVYHDLSFADYLAIDAVSNSRLSLLDKSPRHYHLCPPPAETSAMRLGSLVHCGVLEVLSLAERYAVMPPYELDEDNQTDAGKKSTSKTTRVYKEKVAAFEQANEGKAFIGAAEYQKMRAMVESLCGDQDARGLINGPGPVEVTIVWEDPETGILCKGRIDKVNTEKRAIVDLKTTGNIAKFTRSIADYGYARQMAHYQQGWAVLNGGELLAPWLVPIESAEPHCTMPAPLGESSLEAGDADRSRLMQQLAECLESGSWPGPEPPETWELPAWAREETRIRETETEVIVV